MTKPAILLSALLLAGGGDTVLAASADDDITAIDIDFGGALLEDFTYLDGLSRQDNVAQQWRRRRAVLGSTLEFGKRITLELEGGYGAADSSFRWRDAYVFFDLPNRIELTLGKTKQNFGLARSTSLKNLLTVERPMVTDLLNLKRAEGAMLALSEGPVRVELGRFHARDEEDKPIDSTLARVLYEYDADFHWHAGLSLANEEYDGAVYRARSQAETDIMDNDILRAEKITAEHVDYAGFDAAWQSGRFLLQGEIIGNEVVSPKEGDRRYAGGYLQGSLFLTPDRHEFKDGVLGSPTLAGDVGWELVATHSTLDALSLDDGFTANTTALGLNFYSRSRLKVMAEINSLRVTGGKYEDEEGFAALLRLQYRW